MLEKTTSLLPEERRIHGRRGYQSKEDKKRGASERQAERAQRTPQEQLDLLNQRLGLHQGAMKERARLTAQICDRQK